MSYQVMRSADGKPRIILTGEPPYCRALDAAPPGREPELSSGWWLIMVFAAWSMPDIRAIQTALDVAKRFSGRLNLGLRPFDDPEECGAWCPGHGQGGHSPLWVLLRDGEVCMKHSGLLTVDELVEVIGGRMSRSDLIVDM